jgi:hypothetical protein
MATPKYIFTASNGQLLVKLNNVALQFEGEETLTYKSPTFRFYKKKIRLNDFGIFVQDFKLENFDNINGAVPTNIENALNLLVALVPSSGGGGGGGDASAANQILQTTALNSIDAKAPTLGQKSAAGSVPVIIANNQTPISIKYANTATVGTISALNGDVVLPIPDGMSSWLVQMTGTWVGTVQFEASSNNIDFIPVLGAQSGTSVVATSSTTNGVFRGNIAAYTTFRARFVNYTSGNTTINISLSPAVGAIFDNTPLSEGTNSIGQVTANAGTNLNTSALSLESTQVSNGTKLSSLDKTTALLPYSNRLSDGTAFYDARQIRALTSTDVVSVGGTLPAFAAVPSFKTDLTTPGTTNKVSLGTDVVNQNLSQINGSTIATGAGASNAQTIRTRSSDEEVNAGYVVGQSLQTAVVNNILTITVGTAASDLLLYNSGTTTIVSTGTAGTYIFEGSNDNVTFEPISVKRSNLTSGAILNTAITATASTLTYEYAIKYRYVRLRIVTAITGGAIQAFSRFSIPAFAPEIVRVANSAVGDLNANIGTVGTVTAVTTVATVSNASLNSAQTIVDVASSVITTTASSATITPANGVSYTLHIPVTALSGASPTLIIDVQESMDGGTTWFNVYRFPTIIAVGNYYMPFPVQQQGSRIRYVQTLGGTTPSFTRAINRVVSQGSVPLDSFIRNNLTQFRTVALTGTVQSIKTTSGRVYGYNFINLNASIVFVKFFDATTVALGGTAPIKVLAIPANGVLTVESQMLVQSIFNNAIQIVCVTGIADSNAVAPPTAIYAEVYYV